MSLFKKISPGYMPAYITDPNSIQALREKILQAMLLVASVIGLPLAVLGSVGAVANKEIFLPFFYLAIYAPILGITITRSMSYGLRGHLLTYMFFLMAVSELAESGQMGEVRMILLAFVALTATLFNYKNIIVAIMLSLVVIAGIGIYVNLVPVPFLPMLINVRQGTAWTTSSVTFLLLALIISGSISMIIDGLNTNVKKQVELARNLEVERDSLEKRIEDRTNSLTRQMVQVRTAADISRTISALNAPEILFQQVANLIKERFELYYVGIFIIEPSGQNAVLQSGTGEAGKQMLAARHQLLVAGSSMIGWCITNREARIALDVGVEAVRFNNPNLPLTRSEMALPIIAHDHVLGAMSIQSEKPNAFDENDVMILKSISDSLAIAIENDRLFNETRRSLEEIKTLNRDYLQRAWAETIESYGTLSYDYQNPATAAETKPASVIQVPILLRDEIIGHIALEIDRPTLTEDETSFVDNISTQTAIALENARLLHETERRAIQEQKLNQLATRFSRAVSIDEILRVAAKELGQLPAVSEVAVQLSPTGISGKGSTPSNPIGGNGKGDRS